MDHSPKTGAILPPTSPEDAPTSSIDEHAAGAQPISRHFEFYAQKLAAHYMKFEERLSSWARSTDEEKARRRMQRTQHSKAYLRDVFRAIETKDLPSLYERLNTSSPTTMRYFLAEIGWTKSTVTTLVNLREALRDYVGPERYDAFLNEREELRSERATERARTETIRELESQRVRYMPDGATELRIVNRRQFLDAIIQEGFAQLSEQKQGAVNVSILSKPGGHQFYKFRTKEERFYLSDRLQNAATRTPLVVDGDALLESEEAAPLPKPRVGANAKAI